MIHSEVLNVAIHIGLRKPIAFSEIVLGPGCGFGIRLRCLGSRLHAVDVHDPNTGRIQGPYHMIPIISIIEAKGRAQIGSGTDIHPNRSSIPILK